MQATLQEEQVDVQSIVSARQVSYCFHNLLTLSSDVVNTRGTGEPQMQSSGFFICNQQLLAKVPGGTLYATRYSANFAQISMDGTMDVSEFSYIECTIFNPYTLFLLPLLRLLITSLKHLHRILELALFLKDILKVQWQLPMHFLNLQLNLIQLKQSC
jgi:hypothetical protein